MRESLTSLRLPSPTGGCTPIGLFHLYALRLCRFKKHGLPIDNFYIDTS